MADLEARLLAHVAKAETGCWRWTGYHFPSDYGMIWANGGTRRVHIVAYELWIGPVPDGLVLDHVHARGCRYRDCINPAHLEAVTQAENVRRQRELITRCPQGHEYTPENTKWRAPRPGRALSRSCRQCTNNAKRAARARRQEAA